METLPQKGQPIRFQHHKLNHCVNKLLIGGYGQIVWVETVCSKYLPFQSTTPIDRATPKFNKDIAAAAHAEAVTCLYCVAGVPAE